MPPPTVLFDLTILATDTRMRGIGRYVAELAPELAALSSDGIRVLFLEELSLATGVRVTEDGAGAVRRLLDRRIPEVSRWSWAYRSRLGTCASLILTRTDWLHIPHTGATPLWTGSVRRLLTCHDLIPLRYPQHYCDWRDGYGRGRRLLDQRRYHSADHILAISQATASDLTTLLDVPREKISVVLHGINAADWPAAAQPGDAERLAALSLPSRYALFVGDADWRKNHIGMFRAIAAARKQGLPITMVWAGRLSPARLQQLTQDAMQHNIPLMFTGFVDDDTLRALYRQAHASLFISRAEGFGYPVLEAMALGCPVITSDCSSMPEVAGEGALLVDPEDAAQVAAALLSLADEGRRKLLRQAGFVRAQQLSRRHQAEETLALYRRLLG